MLLSLPDSWKYSVRGLAAISREGPDGIMAGLKELEQRGYLERHQTRQMNGRMGQIEYVIFEMPNKKPDPDSPCTEKSGSGKAVYGGTGSDKVRRNK